MAIILTKKGKDAKKLDPSRFEQEHELQSYIAENPNSLPLHEIKDDVRLLIVAREFPTVSGPIDAIGIDRDGEIYIIETKLYKNPDKRLVVAQILDYGASLWRNLNAASFLDRLESPAQSLFGMSLNDKMTDFFGLDSAQCQEVKDALLKNLSEGAFDFVVLMDKLHDGLRDMIVFLNQNSNFDIYAVEMEYYKFDEYEIIIPKLFGGEVRKNTGSSKGSSSRKRWDEASYFADAKSRLDPQELASLRSFFDFCRTNAKDILWGKGKFVGSFNPIFSKLSATSLFTVFSDGRLAVNFGYMDDSDFGYKLAERLKDNLEKMLGVTVPPDYNEYKFPTYLKNNWLPKAESLPKVIEDLLRFARQ
jgi:hypothetical protein